MDTGLPEILISSWAEAPRILLDDRRAPRIACLVSMGDPGESVPAGYARVERRLRLELSDIRGADEMGVLPDAGHVQRLLDFADVIRAADGPTLFHCQAGISRSTAAAFSVLAKIAGAGRELVALDHVLHARPIAVPNTRIVEIADKLLLRDGALTRALFARGVLAS